MKPLIYQTLKTVYGYDEFRPLQEDIILRTLSGKDSLVLMPTGGGKSVCFQIPALCSEGTTIVISPLISLMKDQVQALQTNGVKAAFYNSSLTQEQENDIVNKALQGEIKMLYISPEKLISVKDTWISKIDISLVAIDEAHCVSMWGHDFRPEYTQLKRFRQSMPNVPFIALTATADKSTRIDIITQLNLTDPEVFISSFDRPNISIDVKAAVPKKQKHYQIEQFIKSRRDESGIIYCLSRKNTEEIAGFLRTEGISVDYYHAGMTSERREKVQSQFINDDIKIVVATIAFGMGIDKSNVRWVIHNNLPKNLEGYYQEIGRAGRDGLASEAVLYYSMRDVMLYRKFAEDGANSEMQIEKLNRMLQFAEAKTCRRKILLSYFGEHVNEDCKNCDACHNPPTIFDGTIIAQKALSAVIRTGQKEPAGMLINVLRASNNHELIIKNYQQLPTYGVGREISFFDWKDYMVQFVNLGAVEIAYSEQSAVKITPFGMEILRGNRTCKLTVPIQLKDKKQAKEKYKKSPTLGFSNDDSLLFDQLKKVRYKLSKQEGVPAYIIFNDKTLKEMASERPQNKSELLAVNGVGKVKLEKFGQQFLDVING